VAAAAAGAGRLGGMGGVRTPLLSPQARAKAKVFLEELQRSDLGKDGEDVLRRVMLPLDLRYARKRLRLCWGEGGGSGGCGSGGGGYNNNGGSSGSGGWGKAEGEKEDTSFISLPQDIK
jgi:uncharacterized membrane protein YgcG